MISEELKQEWLEKVSVGKREDISSSAGYSGYVTVHTPLRTAPEEVRLDRDIVEKALLSGEEYFWNIDMSFRKDKEFILSIIDKGYKRDIYDHISYTMESDPDIFKKCILRKEKISEYKTLDESIVKNKELILELLPHYNFFKNLKGAYDQDKEVLSIYMLNHVPRFFDNLGKRMFNHFHKNKPFLVNLLKVYPDAYKTIHPKLLTDLEIVDAMLSKNHKYIAELPQELRDDKGFMMYAIQKYGCTLTDAKSCHSNDIDLLRLSIEKNGKDLFNSSDWSTSVELLEIAMQTEPSLSKVDKSVWQNINLVIKYLEKEDEINELRTKEKLDYKSPFYYSSPNNLSYLLKTILPELKENNPLLYRDYISNKKIIEQVIKKDIKKLELFPNWKDDIELADMAFDISNSIEHLHDSKLYNKTYMLELINSKPNYIKDLISYTDFYVNDYDFLNKFLDANPNYIMNSPVGKADKKIIDKLLTFTSFNEMKYIDSSLWSDKELVLKFIEKNNTNYVNLSLGMRQDTDVIDKMLNHGVAGAMTLIKNSGFGDNLEFHKQMCQSSHFFYEAIDEKSPFKSNREVIESYLSRLSEYEAITNRNYDTKFPLSTLLKYGIENSSASQLKPEFLKYELEKELVNKEDVIAPKKLKL